MLDRLPIPARIPILYVMLGVLLLVSVVPLYFYSAQVEAINRDRLKTNEMLLQNTVTRSLGEDIEQRHTALRMMLSNLSSAIQVSSGGDIAGDHVASPELRALLEKFVSSSDDLIYATILNQEAKGISAGRMTPDAFLQRELESAYAAARDNRPYNGQAISVGSGKNTRTIMVVSTPVTGGGRFIGMIAAVVDLKFLIGRLQQVSTGGLTTYVVDRQGRLVAGATWDYATGQDMTKFEIVKNFAEQGGKAQFAATREFDVKEGKESVPMLGTYSPVQTLGWAVVAQKKQKDAYQGVWEMQRSARLWAFFAVLMSIVVSVKISSGLVMRLAAKILMPILSSTASRASRRAVCCIS